MSKARDLANAGTALTTVSATELGYLDGVTSAVQTQVDAKIAKSTATTKGDLLAATASATVARLAVGANNTVLTADSAEATGLKWATPAAGGMTLISTTSLTGSTITLSSIPATYNNLQLVIRGFKSTTDGESYNLRFNGVTTNNYVASTDNLGTKTFNSSSIDSPGNDNTNNTGFGVHNLYDYANTVTWKLCDSVMFGIDQTTTTSIGISRKFGAFNSTSAISSITIFPGAGTFSGGTALLYGVK
jgi:hypothetical protein